MYVYIERARLPANYLRSSIDDGGEGERPWYNAPLALRCLALRLLCCVRFAMQRGCVLKPAADLIVDSLIVAFPLSALSLSSLLFPSPVDVPIASS